MKADIVYFDFTPIGKAIQASRENAGDTRAQIAEMVGQKEQCTIVGEIEGLELADIKKSRFLNKELSLNDNGIHTGDRLLLV